jgi:hypothetical protein
LSWLHSFVIIKVEKSVTHCSSILAEGKNMAGFLCIQTQSAVVRGTAVAAPSRPAVRRSVAQPVRCVYFYPNVDRIIRLYCMYREEIMEWKWCIVHDGILRPCG